MSKTIKIISFVVIIVGLFSWSLASPISAPQQSVQNEQLIIWILLAIWIVLMGKKD